MSCHRVAVVEVLLGIVRGESHVAATVELDVDVRLGRGEDLATVAVEDVELPVVAPEGDAVARGE
jgi:hypothetical protein